MRNLFNLALPMQPSAELEQTIRQHSITRTVSAKQVFLEAEDQSMGVYYILSGRTRHYLLGADGSEKILYVLTSGWFFGEEACCLRAPHSIYALAEEKTELCFIPVKDFHILLASSGEFSTAVMNNLARKSMMLCHEIENLTFFSCKDRLLQLFYANADASFAFDGRWYPLKHNYTLQELGTILGVSRVTVSKFVNEFCNEGVIRIVNRRMQINIRHYNRLDSLFSS